MEYQDDEEEEEEDEELVRDLTGGGALAAVQLRVLVGGCCRGRAYVSSWEAAAEAVAHFVSR